MTVPLLPDTRRWLADGTAFLLDQVDVTDVNAPSLLPGWSNAYVLAHVARNADAVGRLLVWAQTGVETPMYASPAQRAAEIDRDADRAPDVLRLDAHESAGRFNRAVETLDAAAWQVQVRSARGRLIQASEVPWMRVKEVWLHAVDLGAPLAALPADVSEALLTDIAAAFDAKDSPPGLRLVAPERKWTIGDAELEVTGQSANALLGWLVGRSNGSNLRCDQPLPQLPPWL